MNRLSTHCSLAVALALFSIGQSQWLSPVGLGVGRACADEIEDIGEDEAHFVGNQAAGGSGTVTVDLGGTSVGVIGSSFFVGFEFDDPSDLVANHGIWANNFGTVFVPELPSGSAEYTVWANKPGFGDNEGIWANNSGNTGARVGPDPTPATYGYPGMMDAGDYTDWANNFGQSGDAMPGDFNADGTVDIVDKLEWDRYFGEVYIPEFAVGAAAVRGASLTAAPVPEPSGLALAALALFALAAVARITRRRSK